MQGARALCCRPSHLAATSVAEHGTAGGFGKMSGHGSDERILSEVSGRQLTTGWAGASCCRSSAKRRRNARDGAVGGEPKRPRFVEGPPSEGLSAGQLARVAKGLEGAFPATDELSKVLPGAPAQHLAFRDALVNIKAVFAAFGVRRALALPARCASPAKPPSTTRLRAKRSEICGGAAHPPRARPPPLLDCTLSVVCMPRCRRRCSRCRLFTGRSTSWPERSSSTTRRSPSSSTSTGRWTRPTPASASSSTAWSDS